MTKDQKPIRFALVGCGEASETHLAPALREMRGGELWTVVSRDMEKGLRFAETHGAKSPFAAHDSMRSMLGDAHVDAVIIATPDGLHAEQAILAARAGKHVFTEKPMATNVNSALAMTEACHKAGVKLGVAYHNRWHAGHRKLWKALLDGVVNIGELRHVSVHWASPAKDASNWRAFDNVGRWWSMAALGSHCLDLARWFMVPTCGETIAIRALTADPAFKCGRDESATMALRFQSGATADISVSVVQPRYKRLEVHGSKGIVTCTDTLGARGTGTITVNGKPFDFAPVNPYVGELEDFVAAIRDDRPPEVGGVEGMRNVALLSMAEDSAKIRP